MWYEYDDEDEGFFNKVDYDEIRDEIVYIQSVANDALGYGVVSLFVNIDDTGACEVGFYNEETDATIFEDTVEHLLETLVESFPDADWSDLD